MPFLETIDQMVFTAYHSIMDTVTMDRAGRIVIPKAVRERHGFRDGTEFELKESGDTLRLVPVEKTTHLEELSNGWMVFRSDLPADFDITEDIRRGRAERDGRVLGQGD